MEPFSAPVEEVYLVSRYRTLTVTYTVSGTLVYLPSPRHRERAGLCKRMLEMNYFCSFLFLAKTAVFFRCLNMLLLRIIWRTAALWREKNSNLRGGKIALLFRGLNMHLLRITLEHSRYLNERKTINLQSGCKEFGDAYHQDPGLCAFPAQAFWRQSFGLPFDLCGILP